MTPCVDGDCFRFIMLHARLRDNDDNDDAHREALSSATIRPSVCLSHVSGSKTMH